MKSNTVIEKAEEFQIISDAQMEFNDVPEDFDIMPKSPE